MSDWENGTLGLDPLVNISNDRPEFELGQFIDDRRDETTFFAHYRSLLLQSHSVALSPSIDETLTSQKMSR
jgi:hypothetical protein